LITTDPEAIWTIPKWKAKLSNSRDRSSQPSIGSWNSQTSSVSRFEMVFPKRVVPTYYNPHLEIGSRKK
jgi:hypothetical protein